MGTFARAFPPTHALWLAPLGPGRLFSFVHPIPKGSRSPRMSRTVSPSVEEGAGRRKTPGEKQAFQGSISRSQSRRGAGVPDGAEVKPSPGWRRRGSSSPC